MQWITSSHVHLDRVATPWLISRFVDPDAEFVFADDASAIADWPSATPIGFRGVPPISAHDTDGTAFAKALAAYSLTDPALDRMERIVAAGIRHALSLPTPDHETADEALLGAALDKLGLGLGVQLDDPDHLLCARPLYDAVYTVCQIACLDETTREQIPKTAARVDYLRNALRLGSTPAEMWG
ncbi:MAG: hypothetical protein JWM31_2714 [Solirubrobacterales bacterium]|nr:hypothetical protein [Solirubrobacterales bacterium]